MQILIDMNLSPRWCTVLETAGYKATPWSTVGAINAKDKDILQYARQHKYIIFTHYLDFGDILAATGAESPSVIQLRSDDPTPQTLSSAVIRSLKQFEPQLADGALLVIDPKKSRVRLLPI